MMGVSDSLHVVKAFETSFMGNHMTALLLQNWDREAAEDQPIIVNPLRHSIPPQFRNGEKLVRTQFSVGAGA